MKFQGLLTALVTPFESGALDEACFRTLVRRQIDGGVDGIVPCGTTGEAPTLSVDEHVKVVRWAVDAAQGQVPVMAGIGSNCTATAIATGRRVQALGVDESWPQRPITTSPPKRACTSIFGPSQRL